MKTRIVALVLLALLTVGVAHAGIAFDPFWIRGGGSCVENGVDGDATFVTPLSGDKAGYGTHYFDGLTFGAIDTVNFTKVAGGPNVPYVNVWVTDNGTHYAIIATEGDYRGLSWDTLNFKVFETDRGTVGVAGAMDWIYPNCYIKSTGSPYLYVMDGAVERMLTGADLASLIIDDPDAYPSPIGTGAPKGGYGFNLVYGDTASNYVGGYHIKDLTINGIAAASAVPEPISLVFFGTGLAGVAGFVARRRMK